MEHVVEPPLYEQGDLVSFLGYSSRTFNYTFHTKKWDKQLSELTCPITQKNNTFLVLFGIPAKEMFYKSIHKYLSSKDNGYVVVSQTDGVRYFVYENEITFL